MCRYGVKVKAVNVNVPDPPSQDAAALDRFHMERELRLCWHGMDALLVDALETVAMGSVAITERAIAAAGTDLTFVQWRVLLIVGSQERGATVGEIAERLGAHASPASRLVSRLRRRGVVEATIDPADRRVTRLTLTPAGRDLRQRVLDGRRKELAILVADARLTAQDRASIDRLARRFGRVA